MALHTWLEPGQEALAAAKLRGAPVSRCQSSNAKHAAWSDTFTGQSRHGIFFIHDMEKDEPSATTT